MRQFDAHNKPDAVSYFPLRNLERTNTGIPYGGRRPLEYVQGRKKSMSQQDSREENANQLKLVLYHKKIHQGDQYEIKTYSHCCSGDHVVCKFDGGIRSIVEW
jgi:hypothetical protein